MPVTIKKIAKDLNLAVSTVSKALRDSHEISAETKARVFEYASKMDYSPNPYASSLKGRRSGNIAVIVPEVADSFFSGAINGIEEIAKEKGYHVMIYLTHEDETLEQSIIHDLRNGRVDGILISVVAGDSQANHLRDLEVPLVFFDRIKEDIPAASVVTNDFESAYSAVQHLIHRGSRRIAFLSMFGELAIIKQRQAGFQKAVHDFGLEADKCPVVKCTNRESENLMIIQQILEGENPPTAVIGSVETVTMQAYASCHNLNRRIPDDVKVIGFSHLQIASLLNPSLTTVTQPAYAMGKTAATLLFKALKRKMEDLSFEKIIIPSDLIVRNSTR
jgi:LacI family transcriptional regulator